MRILYYTHSAFFELALCLVRELSQHAAVDLVLEMPPSGWRSAGFDAARRPLPPGLVPADAMLAGAFPEGVRRYWQSAASFHLAVHHSRRSLHPASWRLSRSVLRLAADRRADVLHIDDVDVSPRLALALRGARHPPAVIAVHDPHPHMGEHDWRKALARRLAYPAARRFILYNHALRDGFAARYRISPGAIDVAHLGPYDVFREWAVPAGGAPPLVLFFGRLSRYKGLEDFYEAAPLIAKRVPDVRLVVAGQPVQGYSPPPPPRLDGCRIEMVDRYLSNAEVAQLVQSAGVVVCPYRDATQSGVVLTAFAFRVPVVATASGGLPEYVIPERTGLVVPVGNAGALAEAVCRILLDPALSSHIRAGIDAASREELSWHRTAQSLMRAYASAIASR